MLRDVLEPPQVAHGVIVSRIKIMARLDIARSASRRTGASRCGSPDARRRARFDPANGSRRRVVLRLLDKQAGSSTSPASEWRIRRSLPCASSSTAAWNHLVTGPTGSGKTTTLYAAIGQLDAKRTNIVTVEDPIEYDLDGVGQTQVNPRIELTFARALRAILRQDPDVVMIGRSATGDRAIAVQASLTGTWCSRPCTPTMRRAPWCAWSTWESSRSWSPRACSACSPSAGAAAVPGVPRPHQPDRAEQSLLENGNGGAADTPIYRERLRGMRVHGLPGPHRNFRAAAHRRRSRA